MKNKQARNPRSAILITRSPLCNKANAISTAYIPKPKLN